MTDEIGPPQQLFASSPAQPHGLIEPHARRTRGCSFVRLHSSDDYPQNNCVYVFSMLETYVLLHSDCSRQLRPSSKAVSPKTADPTLGRGESSTKAGCAPVISTIIPFSRTVISTAAGSPRLKFPCVDLRRASFVSARRVVPWTAGLKMAFPMSPWGTAKAANNAPRQQEVSSGRSRAPRCRLPSALGSCWRCSRTGLPRQNWSIRKLARTSSE